MLPIDSLHFPWVSLIFQSNSFVQRKLTTFPKQKNISLSPVQFPHQTSNQFNRYVIGFYDGICCKNGSSLFKPYPRSFSRITWSGWRGPQISPIKGKCSPWTVRSSQQTDLFLLIICLLGSALLGVFVACCPAGESIYFNYLHYVYPYYVPSKPPHLLSILVLPSILILLLKCFEVLRAKQHSSKTALPIVLDNLISSIRWLGVVEIVCS